MACIPIKVTDHDSNLHVSDCDAEPSSQFGGRPMSGVFAQYAVYEPCSEHCRPGRLASVNISVELG